MNANNLATLSGGREMNFFKLYIGDYQRDTGTLTLAEHGAYMLMLQHFYATEKGLPSGKELHRLLRADSRQDRDAIDLVAAKFWVKDDAGQLHNSRAAEEIQRKTHQAEKNREIGKLGGRPKKANGNRFGFDSETESKPIHNPNHSQSKPYPSQGEGIGGDDAEVDGVKWGVGHVA